MEKATFIANLVSAIHSEYGPFVALLCLLVCLSSALSVWLSIFVWKINNKFNLVLIDNALFKAEIKTLRGEAAEAQKENQILKDNIILLSGGLHAHPVQSP